MGKFLGQSIAVAILLGSISLASAAPPKTDQAKQKAAIDLVRAQLKDPASAQFKGLKPMGGKGGFCGWVNARNSYGGYTGFAIFYVNSNGKVAILPPEASEDALCP